MMFIMIINEFKNPPLREGFLITNFQKSTKKVGFAALLKHFFNFVPRGTIAPNFFRVLFS